MATFDQTTPSGQGMENGEPRSSFRRPLLIGVVLVVLAVIGFSAIRFSCRPGGDAILTSTGEVVTGSLEGTETLERGAALEGRALELTAGAATIVITGADTTHAHFRFEKVARADDDAALKGALHALKITEAGDEQTYRYIVGGRRQEGTSVRIHAVIPHGTPLHLVLDNGNVHLSDLDGTIRVENQNGDIAVRRAGATVEARTRNGNLDVEMAALPVGTRVVLETRNGDVIFGTPSEASARIEAETRLGGLHIDALPFAATRLRQTDIGQTLAAELGSGAAEVNLKTENGDIILHAVAPVARPVPAMPADTTAMPAPPMAPPEAVVPDSSKTAPAQE